MSAARQNGIRSRSMREGGARAAALEVLIDVLERHAYSNLSTDTILRRFRLDPRDRAFATALIYGTISRIITLDHVLGSVSHMPLSKMDAPIRNLLRMGVWQLMYARSVPPRAACNESVSLANIVGNSGSAGMVNGILRRIAANPPEILPEDFALFYSLPTWLADALKEWLGLALAAEVADASNQVPPLSIRVNRLRTDPEHLSVRLAVEGVQAFPGIFHPDALRIDLSGRPVNSLPSFSEGLFMVQDEAAMLVSTVAGPLPGQTVADLCAAPGGKTCHMAEVMGDQGRIYAFDLHAARLDLISQNAQRLGIGCIETQTLDASCMPEPDSPVPMADLVLCDVPCSGLGLLARKPDIRLHMDPQTIQGLVDVQRRILDSAARYVKPGGSLVYSTCTLHPDENERQADGFLERQEGRFTPLGFAGRIPSALGSLDRNLLADAAGGRIRLLPGVHGCDGFFIARFRRDS